MVASRAPDPWAERSAAGRVPDPAQPIGTAADGAASRDIDRPAEGVPPGEAWLSSDGVSGAMPGIGATAPDETGDQAPAGDAAARARLRFPHIRLPRIAYLPRTFRGRLALVTSAVVAIALLLVLAVLPRLLDGYFRQQEEQSFQARATAVRGLLFQQLRLTQSSGEVPIIAPAEPPRLSDAVLEAFTERSSAPQEQSYLDALAESVAQADLEVSFYAGGSASGTPVTTLLAHAPPAGFGQNREQESLSGSFQILDTYWSQFANFVPVRTVSYTLSQPYSLRQETLQTLLTVLVAVAIAALTLAVVVAFVVADRLTTPLRRLIRASRALAEGDLDARVTAPPSGAPEIGELATTFNRMAGRLQESIEIVRRDRDRSREFLADVSHELRTPIAALLTFNELLQDSADEDPITRKEFLESSHQQIERLDWLAANLLELSKLDSGLVALDLRPDDLRAVVESAVHAAEAGARRKGVSLTAELPPQPVRQRHDPQRLGQVLSNLIGNAVKFTPSGGSVNVSLRGTRAGAAIVVSDTGVGIDTSELPHVFDRFYRGSRANEVRASGSGLGLSIARSIVEMHGGRIAIASSLGRGTQVEVTLPRDAGAPT
jgi:signal transduction histidine kinase